MTPMTTFTQALDAIARTVRDSGILPGGALIERIEGPMYAGWLKDNSVPNGAALSALPAIPRLTHAAGGARQFELQLGIYFIPAPARGRDQSASITDQVQSCLELIDANRWGLSGLRKPDRISAKTRYTEALARKGTNLWLIDWQQEVRLTAADGTISARPVLPLAEEAVDG